MTSSKRVGKQNSNGGHDDFDDPGRKKTCKCLKNSTIINDYLVAAVKTVASATMPGYVSEIDAPGMANPVALSAYQRFRLNPIAI